MAAHWRGFAKLTERSLCWLCRHKGMESSAVHTTDASCSHTPTGIAGHARMLLRRTFEQIPHLMEYLQELECADAMVNPHLPLSGFLGR